MDYLKRKELVSHRDPIRSKFVVFPLQEFKASIRNAIVTVGQDQLRSMMDENAYPWDTCLVTCTANLSTVATYEIKNFN